MLHTDVNNQPGAEVLIKIAEHKVQLTEIVHLHGDQMEELCSQHGRII